MPKVTFFPIGNADTCLIELDNDRRTLFDFADMRNPDDKDDKRCDLEGEIRARLDGGNEIDVVAFTHLDTDHCKRASEVFWLNHAEKYQDDDRIKIKTMWVPATAILEEGVKGQARTLRSEARHRFIEGEGIKSLVVQMRSTTSSRSVVLTPLSGVTLSATQALLPRSSILRLTASNSSYCHPSPSIARMTPTSATTPRSLCKRPSTSTSA